MSSLNTSSLLKYFYCTVGVFYISAFFRNPSSLLCCLLPLTPLYLFVIFYFTTLIEVIARDRVGLWLGRNALGNFRIVPLSLQPVPKEVQEAANHIEQKTGFSISRNS